MLDSKKGREKDTRFIWNVVLAQNTKDPMDSQEKKTDQCLMRYKHGCQALFRLPMLGGRTHRYIKRYGTQHPVRKSTIQWDGLMVWPKKQTSRYKTCVKLHSKGILEEGLCMGLPGVEDDLMAPNIIKQKWDSYWQKSWRKEAGVPGSTWFVLGSP